VVSFDTLTENFMILLNLRVVLQEDERFYSFIKKKLNVAFKLSRLDSKIKFDYKAEKISLYRNSTIA
jgi:hypothetical protein